MTDFREYYNRSRVHSSLGGQTPAEAGGGSPAVPLALSSYRWRALCRGLYQLPGSGVTMNSPGTGRPMG